MGDPTTIHVNELRALLQYRGGKAGALVSMPPLSFPAGRDVTLDDLRATGLVDSSGQISPAIRPTLEGIGQAKWLKQVILPGPEGDISTYVAYYTPDHRFWGLRVEDGGLTTLCSMDELNRSLLSIFTDDSSSATSIAFTYRFLQEDIYVLVAMIELVLMNSNNKKTGAEAKMPVDDSINPIFNALRVLDGIYINAPGPIDELMNLVSSPARRISILLSPLIAYRPQTLNEIQESLARLVTANLVKPTQTGWILTPEIAAFARDLVPTDQVAYLENCSVVEDRLEMEDILMLAGKGYKLSFCIRSQTKNQVEMDGYNQISWEAFFGEFFNHPSQVMKAPSSPPGVLEPETGQIPISISPLHSSPQKPSPPATEGMPPVPSSPAQESVPAPAVEKKSNRNLIIAIVVIVIMLCCCFPALLAIIYYVAKGAGVLPAWLGGAAWVPLLML